MINIDTILNAAGITAFNLKWSHMTDTVKDYGFACNEFDLWFETVDSDTEAHRVVFTDLIHGMTYVYGDTEQLNYWKTVHLDKQLFVDTIKNIILRNKGIVTDEACDEAHDETCEKEDDQVDVPLYLSDNEFITLAKLAHESDITFNQLVNQILIEFVTNFNE